MPDTSTNNITRRMLSGDETEDENVGAIKKKSKIATLITDANSAAAKPYAVALKITAVRKTMDKLSDGRKAFSHWTASAAIQTANKLKA